MRRLLPFLPMLLLVAGCQHAPKFPVGLFQVASPEDMRTISEAGFNLILAGPADPEFLRQAQHHDLKVLATPARSPETLKRLDRSPGLFGWYLPDEPDLHDIAPERIRSIHQFLKRAGATKPTAVTIYQTSSLIDYAGMSDILIVDPYPVPWLPLSTFAMGVRAGKLAQGRSKPVFAVIQAFDWGAFPEISPAREGSRVPTAAELRSMTYTALAAGASGIGFYCFRSKQWTLPDHPETWGTVAGLAREIRKYEPLFLGQRVWWPLRYNYPMAETDLNESFGGAVLSTALKVKRGNAHVAPGLYVVSVNTSGRALDFQIRLPQTSNRSTAVLGEDRELPIHDLWIFDQFVPYEVHVYGPLR